MTVSPGASAGFVRIERDGSPATEVAATAVGSMNLVVDTLLINGIAGSADTLTITLSGTPGQGVAVLNGGLLPVNFSSIGVLNFNGLGGGDAIEIIGSGGETSTYVPDATTTGNGAITLPGMTINFFNLTPVTISGVANLTVTTPNSNDVLSVDSPAAGQNRVSGTSGGVAIEDVTFFDIPTVTLDMATNDAGSPDDTVAIDGPPAASGLTTVTVNAGAGNDALTFTYRSGAFDPHVVVPTAAGNGSIHDFANIGRDVTYVGVEQINLVGQLADGDPFGVDGTTGNDSLRYTTGATPDQGTVTGTMDQGGTPFAISVAFSGMNQASTMVLNNFSQIGGSDDLTFDGTSGADAIDVADNGLNDVVGATLYARLSYGSFDTLQINAADGDDTITVTPSASTTFTIYGGNPAPPASPGDSLNVATAGITFALLTPTGVGQGNYTFGNRQTVTFFEIESAASVSAEMIPAVTPLGLLLMAMLLAVVAWKILR